MKTTVNQFEFVDSFKQAGREDQFSYKAKIALFEYLEELENDCGTEMELDVIALCCEYTEYEDIEEFNNDYGLNCESLEDIQYHTTVINIDNTSFIIADF